MEKKTTDDLRQELMSQPSIQAYLKENQPHFAQQGVAELLTALHRDSGLSKAELARRAGMSEVYLHQVFSKRRTPSRDRLLCVCIGVGASVEQVNETLKLAGYAQLYPRLPRDAVIIHGLLHRRSLGEINETLFAENEKTLS